MATLTPEIIELIAAERAAGNFASDEDVLREALKTLAERRETIEGIQRGLDDVAAGRTKSRAAFESDFERRRRERGSEST